MAKLVAELAAMIFIEHALDRPGFFGRILNGMVVGFFLTVIVAVFAVALGSFAAWILMEWEFTGRSIGIWDTVFYWILKLVLGILVVVFAVLIVVSVGAWLLALVGLGGLVMGFFDGLLAAFLSLLKLKKRRESWITGILSGGLWLAFSLRLRAELGYLEPAEFNWLLTLGAVGVGPLNFLIGFLATTPLLAAGSE